MKKTAFRCGGRLFYWCALIVPLICFAAFYVYVNLNSILLAFQNYWYDGDRVATEPAGFKNFESLFRELAKDGMWWVYLRNSLIYVGLLLFVIIPVSLLFAYYIYKKHLLHGLFKVMVFAPSIICMMVLVIFYHEFVSYALDAVFKPTKPYMTTTKNTLAFLILFYVATGFSSNLLIYLNAMSQVPQSTVEAAKIDGAGELRTFLSVIIPSIWGTVVSMIVIAMAAIGSEQGNLHAFFGVDPKTRYAYKPLQTIGFYVFTGVLDSGGNLSRSLFPKISALGLIITVIVTPLTILCRELLTRFGYKED